MKRLLPRFRIIFLASLLILSRNPVIVRADMRAQTPLSSVNNFRNIFRGMSQSCFKRSPLLAQRRKPWKIGNYVPFRGGGTRKREPLLHNPESKTRDPEEMELQDYFSDTKPLWKILWESLPSMLHDPDEWGRLLSSGLKLGFVAYLVHAVWKAANEVLEEFHADDQSGMEPAIFTRDHVVFALDQLRQMRDNPSSSTAVSFRTDDRSLAAVSIAQRLALIGMPVRSTEKSSIESILSSLSRSEANLLQECMWLPPRNESPQHLWDRIIGLDRVKRGLASALATVQHPPSHAYKSLFDNTSAGVLLYGPPGCGKTMIAMALSGMAKIPCLLITPSVLLRKYVGETNQQCRTLFSLAHKLSPCIICIDELDGLFRKRSESEHEVSRDLKTEFLQHWEGMLSKPSRNLVVAATNRPFDVDEAVLRRFTQSHLVGLPDLTARTRYLQRTLTEIPTAADVDIGQLAASTEGYSPSDVRRLLQTAAAVGPLRESLTQPRPLTMADIQQAVHLVSATPLSGDYRQSLSDFIRSNQLSPLPDHAYTLQHESDGIGDNNKSRWETQWGNFYNIGDLQIDLPTFDLFSSLLERLNEMKEELSELEEDEDKHFPDDNQDN